MIKNLTEYYAKRNKELTQSARQLPKSGQSAK